MWNFVSTWLTEESCASFCLEQTIFLFARKIYRTNQQDRGLHQENTSHQTSFLPIEICVHQMTIIHGNVKMVSRGELHLWMRRGSGTCGGAHILFPLDNKIGLLQRIVGPEVWDLSEWTWLLDWVCALRGQWGLVGHGSGGAGNDRSLSYRTRGVLGEIFRFPSPMPRWDPQALAHSRWAPTLIR